MKKYFHVIFLFPLILVLSTQYSTGQIFDFSKDNPYNKVFVDTDDFEENYLETLTNALKIIKNDTLSFRILNDLAYYWHTRNLNISMVFTQEGLLLTSAKEDTLWESRFKITEGAILLRMDKLDQAYQVLEEARVGVDEKDLAFIYTQLGYVFERKGELDKAADYAMKTLEIGKKENQIYAQAIAYSDLSNLFWKQSKFEKGLELGLKSLSLYESQGLNNLDYDFTLYVVGNNYLELKKYEKALYYFNRAKEMGERYGFYNNLSDVYISLTDLYSYLGDYQKAAEAGENAVKFAKLLENNFMIMRSWLSIGKYQLDSGAYNDAIVSLEKSIEIATSDFGDEYYLSQAYGALSKANYEIKDFEKAYLALEKSEKLKELIFTAESDQRISLIQTEFEVALKEDTIKIQEAKIEQQKTRQRLVWVISSLLLVLLAILYITYKKDKNKNKLLEKKNNEKEFLLKEIHHRVKNNLEVVSSLLSLQSAQLKDENARNAMQESQNRVLSMSLIHQRLYKGKNLSVIEMKDYFINLASHIFDSYGIEGRVLFDCTMNTIELDVDTAVPLGLIVNELITNSLKHAFPDHKKGLISVQLIEIKKKQTLQLIVFDNGIGQKGNNTSAKGFGSQLIDLLTQQLNGKMESNKQNGTKTIFYFET